MCQEQGRPTWQWNVDLQLQTVPSSQTVANSLSGNCWLICCRCHCWRPCSFHCKTFLVQFSDERTPPPKPAIDDFSRRVHMLDKNMFQARIRRSWTKQNARRPHLFPRSQLTFPFSQLSLILLIQFLYFLSFMLHQHFSLLPLKEQIHSEFLHFWLQSNW